MNYNSILVIIGFIIFSPFAAPAQKEFNNWYFGQNAGITFNTSPPTALINGALNTYEGCASISDANGNLLFYTDAITVYNKTHAIMPNGTGLNGHSSTSQAALVIPDPGNINQYYLFTLDDLGGPLSFSKVDMTLNGGLGDVINKNTFLNGPMTEKLAAIAHANKTDFWLIAHEWESNRFMSYLITASGISAPVISAVGTVHTGGSQPGYNTVGCMKISPNGKRLALAIRDLGMFELFDFNTATGKVANPVSLAGHPIAYGIEFSLNSNFLYGTEILNNNIYQYDVQAGSPAAIQASKTLVGNATAQYIASLQRGPNGKIYLAKYNSNYLGVIDKPDLAGTACIFIDNGVNLGGKQCSAGLPCFFTKPVCNTVSFSTTETCIGDSALFTITDTSGLGFISWNFGDPASGGANSSSAINPKHVFNTAGIYTVQLIADNGCKDTITAQITIHPVPVVSLGPDTSICEGDQLTLTASGPGYTYEWQDGSTDSFYAVSTAGTYYVKATNAAGCTDTDSIMVSIVTFSSGLPNDTVLCNDSLVLNVFQPAASYLWQDGSVNTSYTVTVPGIYWVEITNQSGCSSRDSAYVDFMPEIQIDLGPDLDLCPGESAILTVNAFQNPVTWSDQSIDTALIVTKAGIYYADIFTPCGIYSDTVKITYKDNAESAFIPNVFTPNNDGINDLFRAPLIESGCRYFSLSIYSRWGELLHYTEDPHKLFWNGQVNNIDHPDGVYIYILKGNAVSRTGTVTLIR